MDAKLRTKSQTLLIKLSFLSLLLLLSSCSASKGNISPGTIPPAQKVNASEQAYGQKVLTTLTKQWKLTYSHPKHQDVLAIVERLTTAAGAGKEPWHVYILDGKDFKNAAATRGNHVFIWTGMIDATQNDGELATILGHEIGHVLARHSDANSGESIRKVLVKVGAMAAGIAVAASTSNPALGRNAAQIAARLSEQVGNAIAVYPFSREKEYEADHIGLFLMTKAGYNPDDAARFWKRASKDPSFSKSVEFLSTHPPAKGRYEKLVKLAPKAKARFGAQQRRLPGTGSPRATDSQAQSSEWQILVAGTKLYSEANEASQVLGEFEAGTSIRGALDRSGNWLIVSSPESGFTSSVAVIELAR